MRRSIINILLGVLIGLTLGLLLIMPSHAQTVPPAPVLRLADVPYTGPAATDAPLGVVFSGDTLPGMLVDRVIRAQSLEYLQTEVLRKMPKHKIDALTVKYAVTGMTVGTASGWSISVAGGRLGAPYLAGWTIPTAKVVVLTIDDKKVFNIPVALTTPPLYGSWHWELPPELEDGKIHKVCSKVLRASGTNIGPLDNVKCPYGKAQFLFSFPTPLTDTANGSANLQR